MTLIKSLQNPDFLCVLLIDPLLMPRRDVNRQRVKDPHWIKLHFMSPTSSQFDIYLKGDYDYERAKVSSQSRKSGSLFC